MELFFSFIRNTYIALRPERQVRTQGACLAQRKHENDGQLSMASTTHLRSNLAVEVIDMILRDIEPGHLQSLVNSFSSIPSPSEGSLGSIAP